MEPGCGSATWRRSVVAVTGAAVLLAGCGGGEAGRTTPTFSGPAPTAVTLVGFDMGFRPADLRVAAGGVITYVNEGEVRHDVRVVEEPRFFAEVAPGETVEVVVGLPAGTYELFCSIPGHREAGMEGTLTVG